MTTSSGDHRGHGRCVDAGGGGLEGAHNLRARRGDIASFDREYRSTPSLELDAIADRAWPALRALDEGEIEAVTRPAVAALRAMPDVEYQRRMTAEMLVLYRARTA